MLPQLTPSRFLKVSGLPPPLTRHLLQMLMKITEAWGPQKRYPPSRSPVPPPPRPTPRPLPWLFRRGPVCGGRALSPGLPPASAVFPEAPLFLGGTEKKGPRTTWLHMNF